MVEEADFSVGHNSAGVEFGLAVDFDTDNKSPYLVFSKETQDDNWVLLESFKNGEDAEHMANTLAKL